jgi:flagellar basal-body rod protein FlgF
VSYGMYIAAEGARAQSQRLQTLANNLANVDTVGFKKEFAVLAARPAEAVSVGLDYVGSRTRNDIGGGTMIDATHTGFAQGSLRDTGTPTDLAIDGKGFFLVEGDQGQYLTRAGAFSIAPDGRLVTQEGETVLSTEQRPVVVDQSLPWRMLDSGILEQPGSRTQIGVFEPERQESLVKEGHNRFRFEGQASVVTDPRTKLRSGYLEMANVAPTLEMMELIETTRAFEANMQIIQAQDQTLGTLVNRGLRIA